MTKRIMAFGASSSRESINKKFASYAARLVPDADIDLLDLNDFEMPIFSIDRERESGYPDLAQKFKEYIKKADGIIISFAEHNGSYTAAYKNIYDWVSRIERSVWLDKPMLLLATSPGGRGAKTVLGMATNSYTRANKNTVTSFSLPFFKQNFSLEQGIIDSELSELFNQQLKIFLDAL